MVADQFPCGRAEEIAVKSLEELDEQIRCFCCIFDIELHDVYSAITQEHFWSVSRCYDKAGFASDNGRLISANMIRTTMTGDDWAIFKRCYDFDHKHVKVVRFRRYAKSYLPTDLVRAILELYRRKSELKHVPGKESEYRA